MLNLEHHLTLDRKTVQAANLCNRFTEQDLHTIGDLVLTGYQADKSSRAKWEARTQAAMDLALQIQKAKSFPWPGCSNICFPLVTIAALQWHARAYPALIQGTDVVKCRVVGQDPEGEKLAQADRISAHMSWQCMEQDEGWEEGHDRLLLALPIVGCQFKKSYFSSNRRHNVSELVLAQDLVLNYYAKSVEECPRKTHVVLLSRNEIHERCVRGIYQDVLSEEWFTAGSQPLSHEEHGQSDQRSGMTPPPSEDYTTPFRGLEQHVSLDLDGDGYDEPYIITVEESSGAVLRIVTRFEEQDIERISGRIATIRSIEYFTKYGFIPSPDGGIYDLGFGVLLGPLNESVNTLINQLTDTATMQNTSGGFLGRGVKLRGGEYSFSPLKWMRVDSTGEDLQKSIMPLPVREPSQVMLSLLSLLINYTNRVSGSTDLMVGENPGQNTPAETSRTMVEQGSKIYNATFKRVWRCMKGEFKKLFILNARYLDPLQPFGSGELQTIYLADYRGSDSLIVPAADPNLSSETAVIQQATMVKGSAAATNGYDRDAVERHWLKSLKVPGWERLFPGSDKVPPLPNPKVMLEELKAKSAELKVKSHLAEVAIKIQSDQDKKKAEIDLLKAQAAKALTEAGGNQAAQRVKEFEAQIAAAESQDKTLQGYLELAMKGMKDGQQAGVPGMEAAPGHSGGGAGPAGSPPGRV